MPRVSVVIPNYNHQRFLDRRIRSVLEQTFRDFELILLDDASTDDSLSVIEKYRSDPRVKVFVNDSNSGSPFPQWNRGVQLACGEYVWIAEADDDAEPELLDSLVQVLDHDRSIVLAYCQSYIIDEDGKRVKSALFWTDDLDEKRWKRDFQSNGSEETRRYLVFKNTIPNASGVVFRRSVFLDAGGAPTNMRLCGDWMVWVLMAMRGDIAFIASPLNLFRQHSGTVRSSTSYLDYLRESYEVVTAIETVVGIRDDVRRRLAVKLLHEWRSEYWSRPHAIAFSVVCRIAAFTWPMNRASAIKFLLLCSLRKALGNSGIRPARQLWRLLKRFVRAIAGRRP